MSCGLNKKVIRDRFAHEVLFFTHLGKYGYRVYEISNGVRWLRIASPGKWLDPVIAGLHGLSDVARLKQVSVTHAHETIAA